MSGKQPTRRSTSGPLVVVETDEAQNCPRSRQTATRLTADLTNRLAVSMAEAAELVGLSESVVRRLARKGEFPAKTVGGRLLVPVAALHAWVNDGHSARRRDDPVGGPTPPTPRL